MHNLGENLSTEEVSTKYGKLTWPGTLIGEHNK